MKLVLHSIIWTSIGLFSASNVVAQGAGGQASGPGVGNTCPDGNNNNVAEPGIILNPSASTQSNTGNNCDGGTDNPNLPNAHIEFTSPSQGATLPLGTTSVTLEGDCSPANGQITFVMTGGSAAATTCGTNERFSQTAQLTSHLVDVTGSISATGYRGDQDNLQFSIETFVPEITFSAFGPLEAPSDEFTISGTCNQPSASVQISIVSGQSSPSNPPFQSPVLSCAANQTWITQVSIQNLTAGTPLVLRATMSGASAQRSATVNAPQNTELDLIRPSTNQVNAPLSPVFTWALNQVPAGEVRYDLRVYPDNGSNTCSSSQGGYNADSIESNQHDMAGFSLQSNQSYEWCVRARSIDNGQSSLLVDWTSSNFSTQSSSPSTPTLSILPLTSADNPSGQIVVTLSGSNAEPAPSKLQLFRVFADNSEVLISESVFVDAQGNYQSSFEVPSIQSPEIYRFKARVARPQNDGYIYSNDSILRSYHFDPSLTLGAPQLRFDNETGDTIAKDSGARDLRWTAIAEADEYRVWRRKNFEACDAGSICYLQTKPFELVAVVPANEERRYLDQSSIIASDTLSYFVTAHLSGEQGPRSNSVSYKDETSPFVSENTPDFSFRTAFDGYEVHTYVCGLQDFGLDNSADLLMDLWFAVRTTDGDGNAECANLLPDDLATPPDTQIFDSLSRVTLSNDFENCALAHTRPAVPGTPYCHRICLTDLAGNQKCRSSSPFNNPNGTPSDFAGIKTLQPMADGHSLKATWDLPTTDNPLQFDTILYEISVGSVASNGDITWRSEKINIDDENTTEAVIPNLQTGKRYAVQVTAIDAAGYRVGDGVTLYESTLDNSPEVSNVRMELVGLGRVKLSFTTTNRLNAPTELSALALQLDSNTQGLSQINGLNNYMLTPLNAINGAGTGDVSVVLSLEDVLRVALFENMNYALQVTAIGNGESYPATFSGAAQLLPGASGQTNNFQSTAFAGGACGMNANAPAQPVVYLLIGFLLVGLFAMRRYKFAAKA